MKNRHNEELQEFDQQAKVEHIEEEPQEEINQEGVTSNQLDIQNDNQDEEMRID